MSYGQKSDFQDGGRFNICCIVYQISSKSDDFSLRYGDLTIFKMAASAIVIFKNAVFLTWPLSARCSASSYKISLKSDTRSMSYGQKKVIFKMATAAILNF